MTIRPAHPGDLDAIGEILGRSVWTPGDFLKGACHVAVDIGCVAGFLSSRETAPGEREILFIAVHPDARRRGIGRRLLQHELETSRGAWYLEVRASNHSAVRLYESAGFKSIGLRENYYTDPSESAIVMRFLS